MDWDSAGKGAGGLTAIMASVYGVFRMLRRDQRQDRQEKQVDGALLQVIATLREEVGRLTDRVTDMEKSIVKCHEERAEERAEFIAKMDGLLGKLADYETSSIQPKLL
jgi:hypothetical protein